MPADAHARARSTRPQTIRARVLSGELAFIGSSAGSNAAGQSLHVSICMPICAPPTLDALGVVPFLVSPHYHDAENKAALAAAGLYTARGDLSEETDGKCLFMVRPSSFAGRAASAAHVRRTDAPAGRGGRGA